MGEYSNTGGYDPQGSDAMDEPAEAPAQMPHSNNPKDNGSGGHPATHEGHADCVK